jgi:hypothetical protein
LLEWEAARTAGLERKQTTFNRKLLFLLTILDTGFAFSGERGHDQLVTDKAKRIGARLGANVASMMRGLSRKKPENAPE